MTNSFKSAFARKIGEFLAYKRGAGCYLNPREERRLRSFDRFVLEHVGGRRTLDVQGVVARWLARDDRRKRKTIKAELVLMRQLAVFLNRQDPSRIVLDIARLPPLPHPHRFQPHGFSLDELRLLLREIQGMRTPFRALTFRMLVLVMYCTGLRPGEAVRLTLGNVDLRVRTFFIPKSKGRSRWVPFDSTLARELRGYVEVRQAIAPATPDATLFVQPNGRPYRSVQAATNFRRLFRRAGLRPPTGRAGPRPYDFRHAFAVRCVTRWYREGADLHARLPWLSAYMGHENLLGTEWYLKATPELLGIASRRFAARFRRKEKA